MSRRKTATEKPQDQQQRILNHLETLGVSLTDEQLGRVLREAQQGGWSHLKLLDRLFAEPAARKHERSGRCGRGRCCGWRIWRRASRRRGFRRGNFVRVVGARTVRDLAEGEFLQYSDIET